MQRKVKKGQLWQPFIFSILCISQWRPWIQGDVSLDWNNKKKARDDDGDVDDNEEENSFGDKEMENHYDEDESNFFW